MLGSVWGTVVEWRHFGGAAGVGDPPGKILVEAFSCRGLSWGVSQEEKVGHEGRQRGNAAKIHRV